MTKKTMNKRGDIAITILVIGVIVLCGLALVSFFMSEKNQESELSEFLYLQKIYNQAESIRFSGGISNYPGFSATEERYVFEKTFFREGWFSDEEVMKVRYRFGG